MRFGLGLGVDELQFVAVRLSQGSIVVSSNVGGTLANADLGLGTFSSNTAQFINKGLALRGEAASDAWTTHFANASTLAERTGLTEADVIRMVNED